MHVKAGKCEFDENGDGPRILTLEVEIRDDTDPPYRTRFYPNFLLCLSIASRPEDLAERPIIGYFPSNGATIKREGTIEIPVLLTYEQLSLIDKHRNEGDVLLKGRLEASGWFAEESPNGLRQISNAPLGANLTWRISKSDWIDKALPSGTTIEVSTELREKLHDLMEPMNLLGEEEVIDELIHQFERRAKRI